MGENIGQWIAYKQTEAVNNRFLDLLSKLALEHPGKVLEILVQQIKGWNIGHWIAYKQNEAVNNRFLDLLSELALVHSEKVLGILTQQNKYGDNIGHWIAFKQNEAVNNRYLDLLSELGEKYPDKVYEVITNKNNYFLNCIIEYKKIDVALNLIGLVDKLDRPDVTRIFVDRCSQTNFQDDLFQTLQSKPEEINIVLSKHPILETIFNLPTTEQRAWDLLMPWRKFFTSRPKESYKDRLKALSDTVRPSGTEDSYSFIQMNTVSSNIIHASYANEEKQSDSGLRRRKTLGHTRPAEPAHDYELAPLLSNRP